MCISWTNKGLNNINMHGTTTKMEARCCPETLESVYYHKQRSSSKYCQLSKTRRDSLTKSKGPIHPKLNCTV